MSASLQNGIDNEAVQEIEQRLHASGEVRPFESKVAPEQLNSIYRSAKTREQVEADDRVREQQFAVRISKWVSVKIVLGSSALFFSLLFFVIHVETLWFHGGMAGVSASFILAMLLIFAYYLGYGYTDRVMYRTGRSMKAFLSSYTGIFVISLVAGLVTGLFVEWSSFPARIAVAVFVHLILMSGILMLMLRRVHDVNVR